MAEKFIQSPDGKVYYDLLNEACEQTVVLVHGFGLDRDMWVEQLDVLQDSCVIAVDARGHGKSRPFSEFNVIKVAEDIHRILQAENRAKAVIVGLSMGSYAAQEFVRLYPANTAGLMAADGTPIFIKYPLWETVALRYSMPLLKLYTWNGLKNAMAKQTSVIPEVRAQLIRMFDKFNKDEFISSWAGIANCLHEEKVVIECPFYVVYGEYDQAGTIKAHASDWVVAYPNCKVFVIPNAGHVSNMDNPQEFNRIMLELLDESF